jgi:hypothetical protein
MARHFAHVLVLLGAALVLFPAAGCRPHASTPSLITSGSPDTISIQNTDVALDSLLTEVARHFSLTLDLPPELHGRTSMNLRDVTWRQIFKVTLSPVGYDFYEDQSGRVVVRSNEEIRQLPPITEHFSFSHQTPAAVQAYLARFSPEIETQLLDGRLSVTAHPQRMPALRSELHRIDQPDVSLTRYTRPIFLPATIPNIPEIPNTPVDRSTPLTTVVLMVEKIDAFHLAPYLRREIEGIKGACVLPDVRINALIVTSVESLEPRLSAIVTYLDDEKWHTPSEQRGP